MNDANPKHNHLLNALPKKEFEYFSSHLELADMKLGDVLYRPGEQLKHIYFPTTSIVSLIYVMQDGSSAEIAVVGNEGALVYHCLWVENPHLAML